MRNSHGCHPTQQSLFDRPNVLEKIIGQQVRKAPQLGPEMSGNKDQYELL
jgi:hypothetical protein